MFTLDAEPQAPYYKLTGELKKSLIFGLNQLHYSGSYVNMYM